MPTTRAAASKPTPGPTTGPTTFPSFGPVDMSTVAVFRSAKYSRTPLPPPPGYLPSSLVDTFVTRHVITALEEGRVTPGNPMGSQGMEAAWALRELVKRSRETPLRGEGLIHALLSWLQPLWAHPSQPFPRELRALGIVSLINMAAVPENSQDLGSHPLLPPLVGHLLGSADAEEVEEGLHLWAFLGISLGFHFFEDHFPLLRDCLSTEHQSLLRLTLEILGTFLGTEEGMEWVGSQPDEFFEEWVGVLFHGSRDLAALGLSSLRPFLLQGPLPRLQWLVRHTPLVRGLVRSLSLPPPAPSEAVESLGSVIHCKGCVGALGPYAETLWAHLSLLPPTDHLPLWALLLSLADGEATAPQDSPSPS